MTTRIQTDTRADIIEQMKQLKLRGIIDQYDEIVSRGITQKKSVNAVPCTRQHSKEWKIFSKRLTLGRTSRRQSSLTVTLGIRHTLVRILSEVTHPTNR